MRFPVGLSRETQTFLNTNKIDKPGKTCPPSILTTLLQTLLADETFAKKHPTSAKKLFCAVYSGFSTLEASNPDAQTMIALAREYLKTHSTLPCAADQRDFLVDFNKENVKPVPVNNLLVSAASHPIFLTLHDQRFQSSALANRSVTLQATNTNALKDLLEGLHSGAIPLDPNLDEAYYLHLREEANAYAMEPSLRDLTAKSFEKMLIPTRLMRYYLFAVATENAALEKVCFSYTQKIPSSELIGLITRLHSVNEEGAYDPLMEVLLQTVADRLITLSEKVGGTWNFRDKTFSGKTKPSYKPHQDELKLWSDRFPNISKLITKLAFKSDDICLLFWILSNVDKDNFRELSITSTSLDTLTFVGNLTTLRTLHVEKCTDFSKIDIQFLQNKALEDVSFEDCTELKSFAPVYNLPHLKKLNLRGTKTSVTEEDISYLPKDCQVLVDKIAS